MRVMRDANGMATPVGVHPYDRSPHSGAGNCWCGRAERHVLHPHEPMATWRDANRCTCSRPMVEHPLSRWSR